MTPATAIESVAQSKTASATTSPATAGGDPADPADSAVPASAQASKPGGEPGDHGEQNGEHGPVVVLGTVDLTWADLLAAADADDPSLSSAAKALLAYAGAGQPVNLVTRTVGERTALPWTIIGAMA